MKHLMNQVMKFGVVGGLSFLIDYGIFVFLANEIGIHYLAANFFGFTISLIFNYTMSMKFVFERREGADKRKEFIMFIFLSVVGLALQELIILGCVDGIYLHSAILRETVDIGIAKQIGKLIATAIVMVYNFISRKIFIEGKKQQVR